MSLVHAGWAELRRQRPLAAWARWQQALRVKPDDPAATQALDRLARSDVLPEAAKVVYRFRSPADLTRRLRWVEPLNGRNLAELEVAEATFRGLAEADESDAPARYNQALCLAWLGHNAEAIEALDQVVRLDAAEHFDQAVAAWVLAEVLRHGAGAEMLADDLNHGGSIPWPAERGDPTAAVPPGCLHLVPLTIDPALGLPADPIARPFEWLDRPLPEPSEHLTLGELPRVLASAVVRDGRLRISSPDSSLLARFAGERLAEPDAPALDRFLEENQPWDVTRSVLPLNLLDAAIWTFRLPSGLDEATRRRLTREAIEDYYENRWIHDSRHGLSTTLGENLAPATPEVPFTPDDPVWRAKLTAIINFREQLAKRLAVTELYEGYPFDRLRRRLGLEQLDPGAVEANDPDCMSRAELAALDVSTMRDWELEAARRSAQGLKEPELAERFAAAMARRGPTRP